MESLWYWWNGGEIVKESKTVGIYTLPNERETVIGKRTNWKSEIVSMTKNDENIATLNKWVSEEKTNYVNDVLKILDEKLSSDSDNVFGKTCFEFETSYRDLFGLLTVYPKIFILLD